MLTGDLKKKILETNVSQILSLNYKGHMKNKKASIRGIRVKNPPLYKNPPPHNRGRLVIMGGILILVFGRKPAAGGNFGILRCKTIRKPFKNSVSGLNTALKG